MNVTAGFIAPQSAGLLAMVAFVVGLLAGASLVAVALASREASLTLWAATLQRRERAPAAGPDPGGLPVRAPGVPGLPHLCVGRKRLT